MTNRETTTAAQTAAVAEQGAQGAPEKAASKKGTTPRKGAPKGQQTAQRAKPEAKAKKAAKSQKPGAAKKTAQPERKTAAPRAESKGGKILEMIARPKGATLGEIMKATDWQPHSVRGFISTAGKKHGVKIESSKNEARERVYKSK